MAASLDVIRQVGPNASMDEMAAGAGITKPVLYRYFGDRDGLIAAVAEHYSGALVDRLSGTLVGAVYTAPERVIRSGIAAYVSFIEDDPALYEFLTQHAPLGSPALQAVFSRVTEAIEQVVRLVFEHLGLDTRPVPAWASGIVGMVHLAGARWVREPDVRREQLVEDLTRLVAYGIVGATSAPAEAFMVGGEAH